MQALLAFPHMMKGLCWGSNPCPSARFHLSFPKSQLIPIA